MQTGCPANGGGTDNVLLLDYVSPIRGTCPSYQDNDLEHVQQRSLAVTRIEQNVFDKLKPKQDVATKSEFEPVYIYE